MVLLKKLKAKLKLENHSVYITLYLPSHGIEEGESVFSKDMALASFSVSNVSCNTNLLKAQLPTSL